jgi:hypothetical protein
LPGKDIKRKECVELTFNGVEYATNAAFFSPNYAIKWINKFAFDEL